MDAYKGCAIGCALVCGSGEEGLHAKRCPPAVPGTADAQARASAKAERSDELLLKALAKIVDRRLGDFNACARLIRSKLQKSCFRIALHSLTTTQTTYAACNCDAAQLVTATH